MLLADGRDRGSVDIAGDYAQRFSLGIICDLIGVSPGDRETIKRLSDDTVSMYEPGRPTSSRRRANAAADDFRRYLLDVIASRRIRPADDLLSALIEASIDGERLSDDQLASTAMVLLMAGHEATVNATSNGIAAFAAHPQEWHRSATGAVPIR